MDKSIASGSLRKTVIKMKIALKDKICIIYLTSKNWIIMTIKLGVLTIVENRNKCSKKVKALC